MHTTETTLVTAHRFGSGSPLVAAARHGHGLRGSHGELNREVNDRVGAAWSNSFGQRPPGEVTTSEWADDLLAATLLLVLAGTVPATARKLTVWGALGLDGTVSHGVVSDGFNARPVGHLRDLPEVVTSLS